MLGWDKSSLTFRLKEKGACGRCNGKERSSAFPFLSVAGQMSRTSANQKHFSLTGFSNKAGVFAMTAVFLIVSFGLYSSAE